MEDQFPSSHNHSDEHPNNRSGDRIHGRVGSGRTYVNRAQYQQTEVVQPESAAHDGNATGTAKSSQASKKSAPHKSSTTKQTHKRKPSMSATQVLLLRRWLVLAGLAVSALCVVFFVNNVLHVGKLTDEIEGLKKEQEKLLQQNELVRREIIRLQAPDRITKIARTKLNMVSASTAPRRIVSPDR